MIDALKLVPFAPNRRWFRFSLRTMFVVVTVLCVWLGYHLNWIRERHNAKVGFGHLRIDAIYPDGTRYTGPIPCHAPWPLNWLGEEGHSLVMVPDNYAKEEIDRIKVLFPEAGEHIDFIPVPDGFVWPDSAP